MSNIHKYPTISFRISDRDRREIEARIKASGMLKKDYFTRSCIYNRICMVGKRETVYRLVECVRQMQEDMHILADELYRGGQIKGKCSPVDGRECDDSDELAFDYVAMLSLQCSTEQNICGKTRMKNSPMHKHRAVSHRQKQSLCYMYFATTV